MNLRGKRAFVAGVGDDQGYGWAVAKALVEAGCQILIGTWVPIVNIFTASWRSGKFDKSRVLSDGSLMEYLKLYPIDASFDTSEEIPEEIRTNKRYKHYEQYSIADVAAQIQRDYGKVDIIVHSLANSPEIKNPLLETSRKGYLEAVSASAYSFVGMIKYFGPLMGEGGSALTITYLASERVVPGYGGGMSSAKAALESDTRTLAWEAGRKWGMRVNAISAGAFNSRAARAIGFIDAMIAYSRYNAPLLRDLSGEDVGSAALFLSQASAVTGVTLYVDNGMHAMGVATDSQALKSTIEREKH